MDGLEQDTDLIRRLVAFSRLKPAQVAKQAGVAVTTINRPFTGTAPSRLGRAALEKLQAAFPDFPGWQDYGTVGKNRLSFGGFPSQRDNDLVKIPQIDLQFGLGAAFMDSEIVEHQAELRSFPRAWLRMITNTDPAHLCWIQGQGDSMEPVISDGDLALVDRSIVTPGVGDVYWVIAYGQIGMIKRLRPMPDGSVKILSNNSAVPPETAYDGELTVFGRVRAVVKRV